MRGPPRVGLEVHERTIAAAVRFPEGRFDERAIQHEKRAVNRLVRKWKREAPGTIRCARCGGPLRGPEPLRPLIDIAW